MNIISEIPVTIRNLNYTEITYSNGNKTLKRYDQKYKMWIEAEFVNSDDTKIVQNIINTAISVL